MGNVGGRVVRRQLGTEDIPRTNPAEIYNTHNNNFTDSRVFDVLVKYLDPNALAAFACTTKSIYTKISSDNALTAKIKYRPKTSTPHLTPAADASSYWNNIQQQYSSQAPRISPSNLASVAAVISNEISLSYSLQQQSQKYDWYTRNGRFEDLRPVPAHISSPYNVPNSTTEEDRIKLKELYENGFIQKELSECILDLMDVKQTMELSFEGLLNKYNWKEIPNCPGRYVLRKKDSAKNLLTPQNFLERPDLHINSYTTPVAKDKIKFPDDGGLLSYSKPDGGYVHTLNNPSGLIRKLNHLQIVLQPDTEN